MIELNKPTPICANCGKPSSTYYCADCENWFYRTPAANVNWTSDTVEAANGRTA